MIPYYSSTQGKALEEKVENVESKADGCVKSKDGKVHIPYSSAIGGADSAFPGYNFVLKGMYCYAEDQHAHFDDFIPVIMGNNPSTAKLTYSVPIRDAHGRMFTYCGEQRYQAELEYEVMNLGAVKYVIKKELAKTAVLDLVAADMTYSSGNTVTLTDSGKTKVEAFFATNSRKAVKNIRKVFVETTLTGSKLHVYMCNYAENTGGAYPVYENLQFLTLSNVTSLADGLVGIALSGDRIEASDATWAGIFAQGVKLTMTYTDIPE